MICRTRSLGLLTIFLLACACDHAACGQEERATVTTAFALGAPFCDHMILQRDMNVPIWGWSNPGDEILVEFGRQKKTTQADADGKWVVRLDPLEASFDPEPMFVTSSTGESYLLTNILVGEVWLASGQSNMQWKVNKSTSSKLAAEFAAENDDGVVPIREFEVTSVTSQLHPIKCAIGEWKNGNYGEYSAIAFAFAHRLHDELNVPIGILNCSFSQTAIQAWVPREGFATADDEYSKAIHLQCLQTDPTTPQHQSAWNAFYESLESQIETSENAIKNGEASTEISAPVPGNLKSNRDASWLYNGRMSPVVPFTIRGAIWNQGYANANEGLSYYNNLHSLVRGWRIVWDMPELPVYFHQFYSAGMRNVGNEVNEPSISTTAEMRLGTWMARDIPHTGMASQIDVSGGIHYSHKAVPGQRLALHALRNQYGKQCVVDGPMFKSYSVDDDKVIVEFDHADGGLVVAGTAYNAVERHDDSTGFADPRIIPDGDDHVQLFFLAGEDRIWHPASMTIQGEKVIVTSPAVKNPRGISYATGEVGFQANLYNTSLLPMTPFIYFDHELVTRATWPDEKLKIAGEVIDPETVGKLYEYRKMPLLSVQFRDDAVFQADKPVTIWGSTRNYGEWQSAPEQGECKVHFRFGPESDEAGETIDTVIDVTSEMAEWKVTLPAREASSQPHSLNVSFTIDDEVVHERNITGIVFGDVWCVVAPVGEFDLPQVPPSGHIVRMIENQSNRDGRGAPSRYSICVSRTPRVMGADGRWTNRLAAYWKEAEGLAAALGNSISAKTGRPVGIIYLKARKDIPMKNWIAPGYLKNAPSLMNDYQTVGSQYFDNPYYLTNVRRYINEWKAYWGEHIPAMMKDQVVPDGSSWGAIPSPKPPVGDSTATFEYNVYVHCFTPAALKGILFLTGESMVEADLGENFGAEMSALGNSFKSRFALWQTDEDIPFVYTMPTEALAPKLARPAAIEGESLGVEISEWLHIEEAIRVIVDQH